MTHEEQDRVNEATAFSILLRLMGRDEVVSAEHRNAGGGFKLHTRTQGVEHDAARNLTESTHGGQHHANTISVVHEIEARVEYDSDEAKAVRAAKQREIDAVIDDLLQ